MIQPLVSQKSLEQVRSQLAFSLNRRDEVPNVELGKKLARTKNAEGVAALVALLDDRHAAADAIKALYECGEDAPQLLAPYASHFSRLLAHKNNRLVWGAMTALSRLARADADAVWPYWLNIADAFETGSVITRDHAIMVGAALAGSTPARQRSLGPWLVAIFRTGRPKDVAQWAQSILPVLQGKTLTEGIAQVEKHLPGMAASTRKKTERLLKSLNSR